MLIANANFERHTRCNSAYEGVHARSSVHEHATYRNIYRPVTIGRKDHAVCACVCARKRASKRASVQRHTRERRGCSLVSSGGDYTRVFAFAFSFVPVVAVATRRISQREGVRKRTSSIALSLFELSKKKNNEEKLPKSNY